jgi:hypothetical protein
VRPVRWFRRLDRRGQLLVASGHVIVAVGTAALAYWWTTYWAQYVATNMLPPSVWTLVGLAVSHLLHERKQDERHDDLKQHVTATAGGDPGEDH